MASPINIHLDAFTRMNRANTPYGKAPHKPVFLLTLIGMFERGELLENRVRITPGLVLAFREEWEKRVDTPHTPDFTQPFYHLQNDTANGWPFWFLQTHPGMRLQGPVKSFNRLVQTVAYGYFDTGLYLLLGREDTRAMLKEQLLSAYFPAQELVPPKPYGYLEKLEDFLLNEPQPRTRRRQAVEEEEYVRHAMFPELVPWVYNYTCCFSGMRLESPGLNMIDACHIVPFAMTQDDRIGNGFALCPNLHRSFDHGLLSVDTDYRILVSTRLREDSEHAYSLYRLKGKHIHLPGDVRCRPSLKNLEWHRNNRFRQ